MRADDDNQASQEASTDELAQSGASGGSAGGGGGITSDVPLDDSLRPAGGGGQESHWQEAAAGEIGQGGNQVTGTLGSSGAGLGANTTEQVDRNRDRYSDITQS